MGEFNAELKNHLDAIDKKVGDALAKHDSEFVSLGKASEKTSAELKALLEDHDSVNKQLVDLGDAVTEIAQNMKKPQESAKAEGLGSQFVASDAFKGFVNGSSQKATATFQNNTILEGTDNTVTRHEQLAGVVPGAFRQLTVLPTVSQGSTSSNVIYYSRELAWTNNAAETAEGSQKPESDLTFEEIQETVKTIPHFIKVSKQALDDSSFLSSYIDRRMAHGVRQRIESQIIAGDGVGQNLSGWDTFATVVDAAGTTDIFGLASKMKYSVIAADYEAEYFYMNPLTWAAAETTRVGGADARFVGQNAAVTYVNNGLTPMLWGLPVVLSNSVPEATIFCKSTMSDMYFNRNDVRVEMFEQDENNVQQNLVTVRAEARGALAIMVPAAIVKADITAIT